MSLITLTIVSIAIAIFSGIVPIFFPKNSTIIAKLTHFTLLGLSGISLLVSGLLAIANNSCLTEQEGTTNILSLSYSIHIDPLAGFFLSLIGIIVIAVAFYGPSYIKYYENTKASTKTLTFFTGLFVASMCLVIIANDIFSFIFSWELMSISSYFLVIYHHESSTNRQAGFVYLLMAHLSGLLILFSLAIMAKFSGSFDFPTMQTANLTPIWSTMAFLLAFLGFGTKAGLVPCHVWLPKAHPAAPSHISALMSGVMLKIAVYGFVRFSFTLIGHFLWQWGVLVLLAGVVSAIIGVLYALMEHDIKKLLAYCSIENIGIIFIGLGLSMIFISNNFPILGALGFIAALYHCLNHAIFKSLLFFGAGSIIQHTHKHSLEYMGGLIHKMPQTSLFFLIGCISVSALPPLNGFVSEWLTMQTFLQAPVLHIWVIRIMIPVAAAALALTGALAAACFAKVYGVAFLGKARTKRVKHAKKPGIGMRYAMGLLASLCLLFGVFPTFIVEIINRIPVSLFHSGLSKSNFAHWFWITPFSPNVAIYSGLSILIGLIFICTVSYLIMRKCSHSFSFKKVSAWDCGFGGLTPKMQYTSTAFSMPIRRVFNKACKISEEFFYDTKREYLIKPKKLKYKLHCGDWFWSFGYKPLITITQKTAKFLAKLQGGNIRIYLAYMFFTLLLLLLVTS